MFPQTLAQEGWLLVLAKSDTLEREPGYVRKRLYELLKVDGMMPRLNLVSCCCPSERMKDEVKTRFDEVETRPSRGYAVSELTACNLVGSCCT